MIENKTQLPRFAELAIRFGFATKRMDSFSILNIWGCVHRDAVVHARIQEIICERVGQPMQRYLEYRDCETVITRMTPAELGELRKRIKAKAQE
jgi:hypothetical protein